MVGAQKEKEKEIEREAGRGKDKDKEKDKTDQKKSEKKEKKERKRTSSPSENKDDNKKDGKRDKKKDKEKASKKDEGAGDKSTSPSKSKRKAGLVTSSDSQGVESFPGDDEDDISHLHDLAKDFAGENLEFWEVKSVSEKKTGRIFSVTQFDKFTSLMSKLDKASKRGSVKGYADRIEERRKELENSEHALMRLASSFQPLKIKHPIPAPGHPDYIYYGREAVQLVNVLEEATKILPGPADPVSTKQEGAGKRNSQRAEKVSNIALSGLQSPSNQQHSALSVDAGSKTSTSIGHPMHSSSTSSSSSGSHTSTVNNNTGKASDPASLTRSLMRMKVIRSSRALSSTELVWRRVARHLNKDNNNATDLKAETTSYAHELMFKEFGELSLVDNWYGIEDKKAHGDRALVRSDSISRGRSGSVISSGSNISRHSSITATSRRPSRAATPSARRDAAHEGDRGAERKDKMRRATSVPASRRSMLNSTF